MWIGNITELSRLGYVEATRKAQDRNNALQPTQQWMEPDDNATMEESALLSRVQPSVLFYRLGILFITSGL